jgi:hypothetical protein
MEKLTGVIRGSQPFSPNLTLPEFAERHNIDIRGDFEYCIAIERNL